MTKKSKEMEVQDQKLVEEETERTRECQCFVPRTEITPEQLVQGVNQTVGTLQPSSQVC